MLSLYDSIEEGGTLDLDLPALRDSLLSLATTPDVGSFQHPSTGNTFLYASVLSGQVDMVALVMEFIQPKDIDIANEVNLHQQREMCDACFIVFFSPFTVIIFVASI